MKMPTLAMALLATAIAAPAQSQQVDTGPSAERTLPAAPQPALSGTRQDGLGLAPNAGPGAAPVRSPGQRPVTGGPVGLGLGAQPDGRLPLGGALDVGPQADTIDGRIAFLKAELNPTVDQLPAWEEFAETMRRQHVRLLERRDGMPSLDGDLMERWRAEERLLKARAEALDELRDAFAPLYEALSDRQRRVAATLLPPDTP